MDRTNKIVFIRLRVLEGWPDKRIREELGIPERTYFYWKRRMKEDYASLVNRQKPGPKPGPPIDARNSRRIQIWRRRYGWGPTKIEGHLKAHYGIHVPHTRIYGLLVEKELNNPIGARRKVWGKTRWERLHSMSLWQGDWKDINTDKKPMLTYYDDHSRFIVASKRFDEATTENTIRLLDHAFGKHGFPGQVLTDNGVQFTSNHSEKPTEFELFCRSEGVQVIHSSKGRPTTLGKLENFHGCYDSEIWVTKGDHGRFVTYWNYKRPNGAIGYLYPAEVFYRDLKTASN